MPAELVEDCPRCDSRRITFDAKGDTLVGQEHDWKRYFEVFCVCRHCGHATIFVLSIADYQNRHLFNPGPTAIKGVLNQYVHVEEYISLKDEAAISPPDHLPKEINAAFIEGARCVAVGCHNAAGTMFRLAIDLATVLMLPDEDAPGLNAKIRRDLGLRLPWLFDNGKLPEALKELSSCVKDDGNDAAHRGTLRKEDAEDLLDFATRLFERLYTEPERLRLAKERRDKRSGR